MGETKSIITISSYSIIDPSLQNEPFKNETTKPFVEGTPVIFDFLNQDIEEKQLKDQAERLFKLEQAAATQPNLIGIQFEQKWRKEQWIQHKMRLQEELTPLTPTQQWSKRCEIESEWYDNQILENRWREQKWSQQLDLQKDEAPLRVIKGLWIKQKGPKTLDLQTQEFEDLAVGLRLQVLEILNKIIDPSLQNEPFKNETTKPFVEETPVIFDILNQDVEEKQLKDQAERLFKLEQAAATQPNLIGIQFEQKWRKEQWIQHKMCLQEELTPLTPPEQWVKRCEIEKEWYHNQKLENKWLEQKWPQQLDLQEDEAPLRVIKGLWIKQKGPKTLDLQTQEFKDLPVGLRLQVPEVLNKINAKCVQHNNKFTVKLRDWWNWFSSFFTGHYESNRYSLLLFKTSPEDYEGKETGLPLLEIEAKEAVQTVQSFFSSDLIGIKYLDWMLVPFKEQMDRATSTRMNGLKPLIAKGKKFSDQQEEHYEDLIKSVMDQENLAAHLKTVYNHRSSLRTFDGINHLLYAYLNFYFKWPVETGRPLIELVSRKPFADEKHSILLIGRDPKTSLEDPSSWNGTTQMLDAYERQEDLQVKEAQWTRLLTNEPIKWDAIPKQVCSELRHLYSKTGMEIEQTIEDFYDNLRYQTIVIERPGKK